MGSCNCKNTEITSGLSLARQNKNNQTNEAKPQENEEKYFKPRKPKVALDLDNKINEDKNSNSGINTNDNRSKTTNHNPTNCFSDPYTKNNVDLESIDERVIIQSTKGKNNYRGSISISLDKGENQIKSTNNVSSLQYTINSQVATYNIDKSESNMFNSGVYKANQDDALDPLTKALSMNNFSLPKYEETKIEQRELFSLMDSVSVRNFKDVFEETASRGTYSYLNSEIKKSACLFSIILRKKQQELRYQFNIWKGKNENQIKNKIYRSLALIKFKTAFITHYKKNYYSMLIERLRLNKEKIIKDDKLKKNANNGFINQMITFLNMTNKIDKLLLKITFRQFAYNVFNINRQENN